MEQRAHAGLFTRVLGPPPCSGAPTVVLVHGLGLSGRYFVPLARRLAARGFTVLVPDLPGNARSRAVVRRMPDVVRTADALARWHRRLVPGPSLLVANSVGCQVAAALTYRHPSLSHRLVILGPALTPGGVRLAPGRSAARGRAPRAALPDRGGRRGLPAHRPPAIRRVPAPLAARRRRGIRGAPGPDRRADPRRARGR
ncbi:alpha/beta hydrolase [Streptomyces sp. SCL15-6]|uniref:alpha/beta hydrolase n=1 Tax=Streptomyces sp. SCL15-6 TaxID=2967222 RepID=UPI0039900DFC